MTTTSPKPKTTTEYLAGLDGGKANIAAAAESYQTSLAEKQTGWAAFQMDPSAVPVADAVRLMSELTALEKLTEKFDSQMVGYLKRQFEEVFFRDNSEVLADALERDLAAATVKLPERKKSLVARLAEWPSKYFGLPVAGDERAALFDERQKLEAEAEALEANVRDEKSGIEYFANNPTPANFGSVRGIIAGIKCDA